jgi:hypothetical protein
MIRPANISALHSTAPADSFLLTPPYNKGVTVVLLVFSGFFGGAAELPQLKNHLLKGFFEKPAIGLEPMTC